MNLRKNKCGCNRMDGTCGCGWNPIKKGDKMKDAMMYFLDNGGYELGYNESEMPDIDDLNIVLQRGIKVWDYKGVSEQEYYGG